MSVIYDLLKCAIVINVEWSLKVIAATGKWKPLLRYNEQACSQTKKCEGAPAQSKGAPQLRRLWIHHPC